MEICYSSEQKDGERENISHVVSYWAVPRVVEALLAPEAPQQPEAPYVKVIIDLTTEDLAIEEFDPHRL